MTTPQAAPRGPNPKGAKSTGSKGTDGAPATQTQQKTSPTAAATPAKRECRISQDTDGPFDLMRCCPCARIFECVPNQATYG